MSDFVAGVFVGLSVWFLFQIVLAMLLFGKQTKIDGQTLATHLFLTVLAICGFLATKAGYL